jgi:GTP cyclohydrolase II
MTWLAARPHDDTAALSGLHDGQACAAVAEAPFFDQEGRPRFGSRRVYHHGTKTELGAGALLNRIPAIVAPEPEPRLLRHVGRALTDLRRGSFVLLADGTTRLLVQAAEAVTQGSLAQLRDFTQDGLYLALTRRRGAVLGLAAPAREPGGTVVLPVDDAADAASLRDLADPAAETAELPDDGVTPGGRAVDAAIDLTKLARLLPAAVFGHVPARLAIELTKTQGFLTVETGDVFAYQATAAQSLKPVSEARVPLIDAEETRIIAFRPSDGGIEHLALIIGDPPTDEPALVRLHSECFTGDLLGSLRCDCGDQLRGAIAEISRAGSGVLLYLAQEGRGIGLVNKLRAYELQDAGLDTVDANEELGFDADERLYLPAAEMLRQLDISRVRLLTNNPDKVAALTRCGIAVVERVPHVIPANGHNNRYLQTKATRSGHLL